jgi:D-alanyl-D-alanine carboxypeptidase
VYMRFELSRFFVFMMRFLITAAVILGALVFAPGLPSKAFANPKYAAIVIDAKTGETLFSRHADAPRFPASITKVMTLYILFEEIEAGRLSLNSRLKVSRYAASKPPSKAGVKPGSTVRVRDAIGMLVTKSANDIAAVVAENISGSEAEFAKRMTRTARSIGMHNTTFRNASGLPDARQKTTARDLTKLGLAIQQRFPRKYHYFGDKSYRFSGRNYRNHNRLLGQVSGVDGIKTGYTRASGFNLLSSRKYKGRHVVAVVLGGRSGRTRDAHMADLLRTHLMSASTGPYKPEVMVASVWDSVPVPQSRSAVIPRAPWEKETPEQPMVLAYAQSHSATPDLVTTSSVGVPLANVGRSVAPSSIEEMLAKADPVDGNAPSRLLPASGEPVAQGDVAFENVDEPVSAQSAIEAAMSPRPQSGWVIQIGAVPAEDSAHKLLNEAKGAAKSVLAETRPYTETVDYRGETLWRARFAGFSDKYTARQACSALKRQNFACLAIRL